MGAQFTKANTHTHTHTQNYKPSFSLILFFKKYQHINVGHVVLCSISFPLVQNTGRSLGLLIVKMLGLYLNSNSRTACVCVCTCACVCVCVRCLCCQLLVSLCLRSCHREYFRLSSSLKVKAKSPLMRFIFYPPENKISFVSPPVPSDKLNVKELLRYDMKTIA